MHEMLEDVVLTSFIVTSSDRDEVGMSEQYSSQPYLNIFLILKYY
jgi:hypothetical protein